MTTGPSVGSRLAAASKVSTKGRKPAAQGQYVAFTAELSRLFTMYRRITRNSLSK